MLRLAVLSPIATINLFAMPDQDASMFIASLLECVVVAKPVFVIGKLTPGAPARSEILEPPAKLAPV